MNSNKLSSRNIGKMSRLLNLKKLIDALMNANEKRKRPKMSVAKVNR